MNAELQKKVDRAIRLIQAAATQAAAIGQPLEVCYSGGKDSDVILELAKMAGVKYRAIYKNTTIDPPGTISHVLKNGVEVKQPKESFLQLMRRKGWPSRNVRFCCDELKEYKILDYAILGIRKEESRKRDEIYKEPEICREYSATSKVSQTLPILYWTERDVLDFIQERHITCAPHYYDSEGTFHPERRLGCMCCPLMSKKKRIVEFQRHPNMVKLYLRGWQFYRYRHKMEKNRKHFHNIYEWFVCYLFCESIAEFKERFGPNLFNGGIDCKEFLENYFNIKL